MTVHSELGPGFHEAVYHEALALEFQARDIPARSEVRLPVLFRGRPLAATYRVDFLCFESVVVELKALGAVGGPEAAQLLNYLKTSGCERGLLLNFGARRLVYRRFVLSQP